jgi:hypothetical protein
MADGDRTPDSYDPRGGHELGDVSGGVDEQGQTFLRGELEEAPDLTPTPYPGWTSGFFGSRGSSGMPLSVTPAIRRPVPIEGADGPAMRRFRYKGGSLAGSAEYSQTKAHRTGRLRWGTSKR